MKTGYDYQCYVKRGDGKNKTTKNYATAGKARAAAKSFLGKIGGTWDMSYRVYDGWNAGMRTGGEHGKMTKDGGVIFV